MKYAICITVCLIATIIATTGKAQTITALKLTVHKKLHNIHELPFNKVIMFDNRFDTTKIKIRQDDNYPIKIIVFDKPALMSIQGYIEKIIRNYPKKNQPLYIDVKQMRFTNVSSDLFFWADAYFKTSDHFKMVTTIKKSYRVHYQGYLDSAYRRTITKALNELIEKVNTDYYKQNNNELDAETFDSAISTNVIAGWKAYPIISQNVSANGVYETFDDFRHNKIKPVGFSLQMARDSIYRINFTESNTYYIKKNNLYNHIFAICYDGNIYISILDKYFLCSKKMTNTFYFNVPFSLPNMYTMLSERVFYIDNFFLYMLVNASNSSGDLIGGWVNLAKENKHNKQLLEKKRGYIVRHRCIGICERAF